MNNSDTHHYKQLNYLSRYGLNKITLTEPDKWISEMKLSGKSVCKWSGNFTINDQIQDTVEIQSVWDAIDYFCQNNFDFIIVEDIAYSIPDDGREALRNLKNNTAGQIPSTENLSTFALNIYGKYLVITNQLSEATIFFSTALKKDPYFCEPYNNLGQMLWRVGKQREAFTLFSEALSKNPHLLSAQLNFFEAGMELEEFASVLNVIDYLEQEIPSCIEFKYYKAMCKYRLGDHQEARTILNGILHEFPDDQDAKQLLANYS